MNIKLLGSNKKLFIDVPSFEKYLYRTSSLDWMLYKSYLISLYKHNLNMSVVDTEHEYNYEKYLLDIVQKRLQDIREKHQGSFILYQTENRTITVLEIQQQNIKETMDKMEF